MTPRRETPLDAAEILGVLADHGVDFVVIGGIAVQAHGHVRTTQDIDLVPSPERANLERLAGALKDLEARRIDGSSAALDARALDSEATMALDTRFGGVDIHRRPPGAADYPALRRKAIALEVVGVQLMVAGLDDLIAMKRAAGRPIDRGDVIALTEGEAD